MRDMAGAPPLLEVLLQRLGPMVGHHGVRRVRQIVLLGADDVLDLGGHLHVLRIGHSVADDGRFKGDDGAPVVQRLTDHLGIVLPVDDRDRSHRFDVTSPSIRAVYFSYVFVSVEN